MYDAIRFQSEKISAHHLENNITVFPWKELRVLEIPILPLLLLHYISFPLIRWQ